MALGVYLAVTGLSHSRDALTSLFWPEAGQSEGRANLRRMLYAIGQTLGEDFVVATGDQVRFERNGSLWIDVEEFRRLVAACHQHGHGADVVCADCLPLLTQAADLYRDDFLSGFSLPDSPDFDRWQFFQAEQARSEMALVLELLMHSHRDQGHFAQAIVYAQRRLAFDPLCEPAHRQLMKLYAWTEQAAAAQRQYELCTRLLAQELGVPPAGETKELHQAIVERRLSPPAHADQSNVVIVRKATDDDVRLVTVVGVGLAGSDDVADLSRRADEVQQMHQLVEKIAHRYGGHVERVLGEDVLVLFGRDQIHEDDGERGVRTALDVRRQAVRLGLALRIGVNTGMAYCRRQGGTQVAVSGGAVNLVTRLRNRAPESGVVVGRATYLATRGLCDYVPMTLRLPGVASEVAAYEAAREHVHAEKARGIEGLTSVLVGRAHEMARLHAALSKTMAGDGQAVAIVGEAGVGKSRLASELGQVASALDRPPASPVAWLEGRGVEHALGTAYWLFADMLRAHFSGAGDGYDSTIAAANVVAALDELTVLGHLSPDEMNAIGPPLGWLLSLRFDTAWDTELQGADADWMRQRIFAAIQGYLTALAQKQPLVLVFEDLHWADAHSLALVAAMLDALPGHALLLLCIYRPEAMQAKGEFAAIARAKDAARFTELDLRELSPAQSRQMLASLLAIEQLPPSIRETILAKAQGNPLFLEELVRDLVDSGVIFRAGDGWRGHAGQSSATVPETIQSVVLSRVDRLDEAQRLGLQAASVFGRIFRPALLAEVAPATIDLTAVLASLAAQGYIHLERTQPEHEYSFSHVLVRDAIYLDLPNHHRVELHRRAGQAIEQQHAPELQPYVEEIAHHFDLGEAPQKAVEFLLEAGKKAQAAYLNQEAIAFFQRALEWVDALSTGADPTWRLAALRGIGEVNATLGNLAGAEPPLRQAIALAQEMNLSPAEQVRLLFPICHLLRYLGRLDDLWRIGQEGLALLAPAEGATHPAAPDQHASTETIMLTTFLAAVADSKGQRNRYRNLTGPVIEDLRRLEYSQQLITAYGMAAWWYRDAKQVPEATAWMRSLEAQARQRNDLWTLAYLLRTAGYWLPEAVGDLTTIRANLEQILAIAEKTGDEIAKGYGLTFLGLVQWGLGNLTEALAMQTEALAINERGSAHIMQILNLKGIGFVRLCCGDWTGTVDALERGLEMAEKFHLRVHGVQMSRLTLAHAYRMLGRRVDAVSLYRSVATEDEADGDGQVWIAFALAGLELSLDDPVALRAACDDIATARPAGDPLPLVQWWLEPMGPDFDGEPPEAARWGVPGATDEWSWTDPYGDCSYGMDEGGAIIHASHFYRDLWFNNVSAPRFMRAAGGDFAVEAACAVAAQDRPAMGGLVLWKDARNFLRLAWGAHGPHTLDLMGSVDGRDLYLGRGLLTSAGRMALRLARTGSTVRALCSADSRKWFTVGRVEFPVGDPLEVGVFATGMIQRWAYPGAYPDGAAIRFQSFGLWQASNLESSTIRGQ